MSAPTVRFMGETIGLAKLIKHYRDCARWWPRSARHFRTLTRTVIAEYREQTSDRAQHREAA